MEKTSFKIFLADNQPLTVAGLHAFLSGREDMQIIGQLGDPKALIEDVISFEPSLLIADYNIPGFITLEHLNALIKEIKNINILIISSDNEKESILKALQLGVKGYLTKECSKEEVVMAIQSTAKGEKFFCHKILDVLMEKHFSPDPANCEPTILTVRETEILKFIAQGQSSQKIADLLHLSPHTVQTHRKSIIRKLNIKSPTEFVIYAMDLGIIKAK